MPGEFGWVGGRSRWGYSPSDACFHLRLELYIYIHVFLTEHYQYEDVIRRLPRSSQCRNASYPLHVHASSPIRVSNRTHPSEYDYPSASPTSAKHNLSIIIRQRTGPTSNGRTHQLTPPKPLSSHWPHALHTNTRIRVRPRSSSTTIGPRGSDSCGRIEAGLFGVI